MTTCKHGHSIYARRPCGQCEEDAYYASKEDSVDAAGWCALGIALLMFAAVVYAGVRALIEGGWQWLM